MPLAFAPAVGFAGPSDGSEVARRAATMLVEERATMQSLGSARLAELVAGTPKSATETAAVRQAARAGVAGVSVATRNTSERGAPERLDFAALDRMPAATGDAQWRCLAEAIYYEARGEPLAGQIAVAEVVLNRVDDRRFPDTVCSVTNQGVDSGGACQFSYACDGRPESMPSALPRQRAEKLAALMLAGRERLVTDGATYFHARRVRPGWSYEFTQTAAIGQHIFYRPATRVAQR